MINRSILRLICLLFIVTLSTPVFAESKAHLLGMSALLPGTGQIALGKVTRGSILLGVDVLALNAYWATSRQINNLTNSYKQYASVYAGVDGDFGDRYYQHIQQYISSDDFNQYQELMARNYYLIYIYDPDGFTEYIAQNTYTDPQTWHWQTQEHQDTYKDLRRQTQTAKMYNNLGLGVIILNRIVSVIDVALISRDKENSNSVYFSPTEHNGLMLNYRMEF